MSFMVHDVDLFIEYAGNGLFKINKRKTNKTIKAIEKEFKLDQMNDYVMQFNDDGDFVCVHTGKYFNCHKELSTLWDVVRAVDQLVMQRVRRDDEILQEKLGLQKK